MLCSKPGQSRSGCNRTPSWAYIGSLAATGAMNSRCPICSHHFRLGESTRFITWRFSRRPIPCPDCRTTLVWERRAHLRLWTGLVLVAIFGGLLLGASLAPQIGLLFGFAGPESLHDPFWDSSIVWATKIVFLVLALGAFALMVSGFLRYRLIRYDVA